MYHVDDFLVTSSLCCSRLCVEISFVLVVPFIRSSLAMISLRKREFVSLFLVYLLVSACLCVLVLASLPSVQ